MNSSARSDVERENNVSPCFAQTGRGRARKIETPQWSHPMDSGETRKMNQLIDRITRLPAATTLVHVSGFAVVIVLVMGYQDLVRGRWMHQAAANGQRIAHLRKLMAENPQLREQVRSAQADVEREASELRPQDLSWATDAHDAAFLSAMSEEARRANIQIESFRRGQVKQYEKFSCLDITLKCKGDFRALSSLLSAVQSVDNIVRITRFKLTNPDYRQRLEGDITFTIYHGFVPPDTLPGEQVAVNQ